jgi:hypothetical protein
MDMDIDHSCDSEDGQSDDHIIMRNHASASSIARNKQPTPTTSHSSELMDKDMDHSHDSKDKRSDDHIITTETRNHTSARSGRTAQNKKPSLATSWAQTETAEEEERKIVPVRFMTPIDIDILVRTHQFIYLEIQSNIL